MRRCRPDIVGRRLTYTARARLHVKPDAVSDDVTIQHRRRLKNRFRDPNSIILACSCTRLRREPNARVDSNSRSSLHDPAHNHCQARAGASVSYNAYRTACSTSGVAGTYYIPTSDTERSSGRVLPGSHCDR